MHSIPDESWEKIFNELDDKSLVNASKSCKRWKDIVTSSRKLMKRTVLISFMSKNKCKQQSAHISNHQNAKIFMMCEDTKISNRAVATVKKNANSLINMEISGSLKRYIIFETFLAPLKNLTQLTITHFYPEEDDNEIFQKNPILPQINLPNLKVLRVYNSLKFLPLLKDHQITTFKLFEERRFLPMFYIATSNFRNEYDRLYDGIVAFLKNCPLLKTLSIDNITHRSVYSEKNYPFQLEKCTIVCKGLEEEKLIFFLENHKSSLKNISICYEASLRLLLFMLKELKVEHFELDMGKGPKDLKIDYVNLSITSLDIPEITSIVRPGCSMVPRLPRKIVPKPIVELIKACPNVVHLGLYDDFHPEIIDAVCKMNNLKALNLHYPPDSLPAHDFQINSVETMQVDQFIKPIHAEQLIKFLPHLPNLKFLKINKCEAFTEQVFIDLITASSKTLTELHIGTEIRFSSAMMYKINDARKEGYALKRLSFLENGSRAQEFATFKVDHFFFSAHERVNGYFDINRLKICQSRQMMVRFKNKKDFFTSIECPKKK